LQRERAFENAVFPAVFSQANTVGAGS